MRQRVPSNTSGRNTAGLSDRDAVHLVSFAVAIIVDAVIANFVAPEDRGRCVHRAHQLVSNGQYSVNDSRKKKMAGEPMFHYPELASSRLALTVKHTRGQVRDQHHVLDVRDLFSYFEKASARLLDEFWIKPALRIRQDRIELAQALRRELQIGVPAASAFKPVTTAPVSQMMGGGGSGSPWA
jgi:hypothetical protein